MIRPGINTGIFSAVKLSGQVTDTVLTDRELIIHTLQHVEEMHEILTELFAELQTFRPLIDRYRPAGGADMLTMIQAARDARRELRRANGRRGS